MKETLDKQVGQDRPASHAGARRLPRRQEMLQRQVRALFGLLGNLYGADRLVLKAGKLEALQLLRSEHLADQVQALQRLVYEDPTLEKPDLRAIPRILNRIEDEIADVIARRTVEDKIEKKVASRMQQRHEEYVREVRTQVLKDDAGPENAQTLKRLAILEKMDQRQLARSALEILRPTSLKEVVGQERAIASLLAKIASPFPQHVLLYGPPGVGKTTVARLALQHAKRRKHTPFGKDAPFIEADGTTLRWDPREVTNPLLGSVHDPIYQGARRDLAEGAVPEPKLGLVTDAHGGVLFIDELGELDPMLQNKLLKVLEDKRVYFDSAYYDAGDPNVPRYIRKLFEKGAPADFVLIGATTRDPEGISPAFRSRCAEVYFDPLTPEDIMAILHQAAAKLQVVLEPGVAELIAEHTIEGRKAIGLLADAYGSALYSRRRTRAVGENLVITLRQVEEVLRASRLAPAVVRKASDQAEVGRIFALGVHGFVGSVLEIEAVTFPAREAGKGTIRFNDTAGSMARDSVFNAAAVVRQVTGEDISRFDVHVNVVGGGNIDGPSAGLAVLLTVISAIQDRPLRQDVAVTGEVSIRGKIKAVGGVHEKVYGARRAGMRRVVIPAENRKDIPPTVPNLDVQTANTIAEAMALVFV